MGERRDVACVLSASEKSICGCCRCSPIWACCRKGVGSRCCLHRRGYGYFRGAASAAVPPSPLFTFSSLSVLSFLAESGVAALERRLFVAFFLCATRQLHPPRWGVRFGDLDGWWRGWHRCPAGAVAEAAGGVVIRGTPRRCFLVHDEVLHWPSTMVLPYGLRISSLCRSVIVSSDTFYHKDGVTSDESVSRVYPVLDTDIFFLGVMPLTQTPQTVYGTYTHPHEPLWLNRTF